MQFVKLSVFLLIMHKCDTPNSQLFASGHFVYCFVTATLTSPWHELKADVI